MLLEDALYVIECVAAVPFLAFAVYAAAVLTGFFVSATDPIDAKIFARQMT